MSTRNENIVTCGSIVRQSIEANQYNINIRNQQTYGNQNRTSYDKSQMRKSQRPSGIVSKISEQRSLPPLRQSNVVKNDEMLQASLIRGIKHRNRTNANKKTSKERISYNYKLSKNASREPLFYKTLNQTQIDPHRTKEISPIQSNEYKVHSGLDSIEINPNNIGFQQNMMLSSNRFQESSKIKSNS